MEEKPLIFNERKQAPGQAKMLNIFDGGLRELFFIRHPRFKNGTPLAEEPLSKFLESMKHIKGVWAYYPWKDLLVHSLPEDLFFEVKTARNRDILTEKEQRNYRKINIGIIGMSIGSNIIWPLCSSGGPKTIKIADPDIIELSNLNRMLAPISAIGMNKAEFLARQIYEMDPFMNIDCLPHKITGKNLNHFLSENQKLNIVFDEMDDLQIKFMLRFAARKYRIPVMMVTNIGHNILLDVERFDLEPKRPIFHGLIKDIRPEKISNIAYKNWVKIATKIVGPSYLDARMRQSVRKIGKSIAAIPQMGPTGLISGSVASMAVMRIANGQKLKSGRYFFNISRDLCSA